jgi:hypothetical protein
VSATTEPPRELGKRDQGQRVVREVFGGPFYQQGRGYYVSLEFFAIAKGVLDLERTKGVEELLSPTLRQTRYMRRGLVAARRLLHGAPLTEEAMRQLRGESTARSLQTLLEGLERRVPGRQKPATNWQNRHFYPYPPELIHYDAVERRNRAEIERYTYRGAGAFIYRVLRTDPDAARLARIRAGLRELLAPSDTALGRIATALSDLDVVELGDRLPKEPFEDPSDIKTQEADARPEPTRWQELCRVGVDAILTRTTPKFRKVEALMNWLPLCVVFHQHSRALRYLGRDEHPALVFDAGVGASPVRSRAKQELRSAIMAVGEALEQRARDAKYHKLMEGSQSWRTDPRSFFTATLYACGAMNALKGDRFLTMTPRLIETIVMALVPGPVSFEAFCLEVLYRQLGFVVDAESAERAEVRGLESGALEQNADALGRRLGALGLLRAYSDATRMVSVEA